MASLWAPPTPWPSLPPTSLAFRISVRWGSEGLGGVCPPARPWTGKQGCHREELYGRPWRPRSLCRQLSLSLSYSTGNLFKAWEPRDVVMCWVGARRIRWPELDCWFCHFSAVGTWRLLWSLCLSLLIFKMRIIIVSSMDYYEVGVRWFM